MATVSVIIPTYNRAERCVRAVDSVLVQTHGDVQVIVVDDGSSDDTAERLRDKDERIRYVWQENAGVAAARNRGFREVTGRYVAFLDSDDVWMPRKLETQLRVLDRFPDAGMVWSDMDAVDEDGRLLERRYLRTMYGAYVRFDEEGAWDESVPLASIWPECPAAWAAASVRRGDVFRWMFMGNLVHTSTVLLTAERREAVGDFDETLTPTGEDYDYHLRTCAEGEVAFVDLPTILYRVGGDDQLTSPELSEWMARNDLTTAQKAWATRRDRLDRLPRGMIRRRWAESHRWIGETLFHTDRAASRASLLRSLRYRPWQPRTVAAALLTLLPGRLVRGLLDVVRPLRTRGGRA